MKRLYSILFASFLAFSAYAVESMEVLHQSVSGVNMPDHGYSNPLTSSLDPEDLTIYPNPNQGEFTVQFTLKKAKSVSIEVYDILGNLLIKEVVEGDKGVFQKTVDMRSAAPGYYLLMIRHGDDTVVKRIARQ